MRGVRRTARVLGVVTAGVAVACSDPAAPGDQFAGWTQVAVGGAHACGLAADRAAYCWGSNSHGQTGSSDGGVTETPAAVDTELRFVDLDAGGQNTCGRTDQGRLHCWGSNQFGQLGDGGVFGSSRPVEVEGGRTWIDHSVGAYHVCAVETGGALYCWGGDRWDVALGFPAPGVCSSTVAEAFWPCAGVPFRAEVGGGFEWVEAGLYQTCVGAPGAPGACWGTNQMGQLGRPASSICLNNDALHPVERPCSRDPEPPAGEAMARVVPGTTHACGLGGGGIPNCWGGIFLNFGQVGNGSTDPAPEPVPVLGASSFRQVVTSHEAHVRTFTCGIEQGGAGYCWGANRWGQLGTATPEDCAQGGVAMPCSSAPVPIDGQATLQSIALGAEFACALDVEGRILCWGYNNEAQLGDGTFTSRATPAPVLAP